MRDPYAVLGLEPPASAEEVKAAYRARSMLLHPDLHEGRPANVRLEAERAMAQLTEAYQALTPPPGPGARGAAPPRPSPPYRLGRLVGRSGLAPGNAGNAGNYAFRLGRMLGRHRPR